MSQTTAYPNTYDIMSKQNPKPRIYERICSRGNWKKIYANLTILVLVIGHTDKIYETFLILFIFQILCQHTAQSSIEPFIVTILAHHIFFIKLRVFIMCQSWCRPRLLTSTILPIWLIPSTLWLKPYHKPICLNIERFSLYFIWQERFSHIFECQSFFFI